MSTLDEYAATVTPEPNDVLAWFLADKAVNPDGWVGEVAAKAFKLGREYELSRTSRDLARTYLRVQRDEPEPLTDVARVHRESERVPAKFTADPEEALEEEDRKVAAKYAGVSLRHVPRDHVRAVASVRAGEAPYPDQESDDAQAWLDAHPAHRGLDVPRGDGSVYRLTSYGGAHRHNLSGQTLIHNHAGATEPHGYYEHEEDKR